MADFVYSTAPHPVIYNPVLLVIVKSFAFAVKAVLQAKKRILRMVGTFFRFPHLVQERGLFFVDYFDFPAIFTTCCYSCNYV